MQDMILLFVLAVLILLYLNVWEVRAPKRQRDAIMRRLNWEIKAWNRLFKGREK